MSTATFDQAVHALNLLRQKNVSRERLTALYESGLLSDLFEAENPQEVSRDALRKMLNLVPLKFRIVVDYSQSFEKMIAISGYDITDYMATFMFKDSPAQSGGSTVRELEPQLIHFDHPILSQDAAADLGRGMRPAIMEELFAFGATYPWVLKKFPIIAAGSSCVCCGQRKAVGIISSVGVCPWLPDWGARLSTDTRFLAIPK